MNPEIIQKMERFNNLIAKYNIAELYFNDPQITDSEKLKYSDFLKQIKIDLELYYNYFDENKIEYTNVEGLYGFNIEFRKIRYKKYGY